MIIPERVREFMEQDRLAYISTVSPDGVPNVAPKGSLVLLDDEHLVFADLYAGKTRSNLEKNPTIAVAIVNPAAYQGYQFKGTAELVDRGPAYDEVVARVEGGKMDLPRAKYAVKIRVDKIYDLSMGRNSGKEIGEDQ